MNKAEREEALALATELLAEIELTTTDLAHSLMKASRLARISGDQATLDWLGWELSSFPQGSPSLQIRQATSRCFADPKLDIYYGAAQLASQLATYEREIQALQLPAVSGDYASITIGRVQNQIAGIRNQSVRIQGVLATVLGRLHTYVTTTYYSLRVSTAEDAMFERAKSEIDSLLVDFGDGFLRKLDSAYSNLQVGDAESISGAMNSVRRLIDAFADAVFPASRETRKTENGETIDLGQSRVLNRLKAFIDDNARSDSRAKRLKRSVQDIYDRVSTGVHSDVSASEAEGLFLATYVLLGDCLRLPGRTEENTALEVELD
jgi:hypothetical protein